MYRMLKKIDWSTKKVKIFWFMDWRIFLKDNYIIGTVVFVFFLSFFFQIITSGQMKFIAYVLEYHFKVTLRCHPIRRGRHHPPGRIQFHPQVPAHGGGLLGERLPLPQQSPSHPSSSGGGGGETFPSAASVLPSPSSVLDTAPFLTASCTGSIERWTLSALYAEGHSTPPPTYFPVPPIRPPL